jgi:nitrogen fixation/metabolism regulation signal transduction histidine kinase
MVYVTRTNQVLKSFMESLRYLDTVKIHKGKGKSFEELETIYNEIIGIIRKVETEKESNRLYFRSIIDHANVGILSFDDQGYVEIVNAAFLKMLGIRTLTNIETLASVSAQLPVLLKTLRPGTQKLIRVTVNHETLGLSLKMAELRAQGKKIRLASVQNIQFELEEEELDAWQKLIRVLTHEIMNSVTPVNSLTNTIIRLLEKDGKPKSPGDIDEIVLSSALEGLHSIEKRNKGLISFVQSYRSLTRMQKPTFSALTVEDLLNRITTLIRHELISRGIRLTVTIHANVQTLNADEKLVEQVLLNLISNAVFAVQDSSEPEIQLLAKVYQDQLLLEVHDNGTGIPEDMLGSIFVPFFTTKEEGSGIGLSLSRQIMRVHGGSIAVRSKPGETVFTLRFPM